MQPEKRNLKECQFNDIYRKECYESILPFRSDNKLLELCHCPEVCHETKFTPTISSGDVGLDEFDSSDVAWLSNFDQIYYQWRPDNLDRNATEDEIVQSFRNTVPSDQMDEYIQRLEKINDLFAHTDENIFSKGTTNLEIFYSKQRELWTYESQTDNWISLVSDFGGQFGLWMGISIVGV